MHKLKNHGITSSRKYLPDHVDVGEFYSAVADDAEHDETIHDTVT